MSFDSKRVVFARAIDRSEKKLVRLKRYDGLRRERLIFFCTRCSAGSRPVQGCRLNFLTSLWNQIYFFLWRQSGWTLIVETLIKC